MSTPRPRPATGPRRVACALTAGVAVAALTSCSATGGATPGESADATSAGTVTLVTHESFGLSEGLLEQFEADTGLTVEVVQQADAGALVNQLVLTKDAPLGDLVFGVDDAFASRALDEGVVVPVELDAPAAQDAAAYAVPGDEGALTAVDLGDVCLNVDVGWFAERGVPEPTTLESLLDPAYRDLVVVPDPVTSSPGLAFLLATVGAFGEDGWVDYWAGLRDNGLKVADGWSEAYYTDFTAGGGDGPRPVVLSYASSPPFTVPDGGDEPTTRALLDTCYRQVEYAGVLAGAANPEGAAQLLEFLLSDEVQADIPTSMYMYPVSSSVELPEEWARWAPLADEPFDVAPADISTHREQWLQTWSDTVIG
ncbi:ABC transporter, periplasmic binding protein, thiB subfamily [Cellulomonas flavigena DSM 20109]|uniref:ABC transporter, periplasmic binding protein, thiB subfamily n=1 Tax=Cellulomonas flavigena (strain ATCC 482 / DSM 20109 / BCRC 11376 / JCM 18109 / NBRC 3775 / NCIMB 8073 / NRS 134) TaxID=446466 RepID=D5UGF4_CELFN|nr:thiamine ABC transporter substrate-binding protein [Cellulomonas flavigena]ADG73137.1 ABC transporter, periplasmic binding protein, thiB subfamily [Cellulomonas flavigena DSM 20109]